MKEVGTDEPVLQTTPRYGMVETLGVRKCWVRPDHTLRWSLLA